LAEQGDFGDEGDSFANHPLERRFYQPQPLFLEEIEQFVWHRKFFSVNSICNWAMQLLSQSFFPLPASVIFWPPGIILACLGVKGMIGVAVGQQIVPRSCADSAHPASTNAPRSSEDGGLRTE
jgi:hypothetical protein